jgi:hypothetical protein
MKIGILTYFGDLNSGTNMQAYSLQEALKNHYGNETMVEIINYHAWNRMLEWHPYLSSISVEGLVNDVKRLSKYHRFLKSNLNLVGKRIISRDPQKVWSFIKQKKYDAVYVGSDTLLELDRYKLNEVSAFWLPSVVKAKKVLIAASSKNLEFSALSEFQKEQLKDSISGFSLLGVRDEATARLIKNFIPTEDERLQLVPDPTFSYTIDYCYVENYLKSRNIDIAKPTICLHLTKDTPYSQKLAKALKERGYQIASLRPAYWADVLLNDMSPLELVGIFRYFTAVVTHRFHDSIFCFKNLTPVITIPVSFSYSNCFGESKYTSLFKTFGVYETNLVKSKDENTLDIIVSMIDQTINHFPKETVKSKLNELSSVFNNYVKRSIPI